MLRPDLEPTPWRVSSGTAEVTGLARARLDCAPTTAYVMLGERCAGDCAFCAQARSSMARADLLSRVAWPQFASTEAAAAIARACAADTLRRVCFQVTTTPGHVDLATAAVREMRARSACPICVSVAPRSLDDIALLLDAGAARVTLAIDAACERVYEEVKSGSWQRTDAMLSSAAQQCPGRIGTHLIAGLGETEHEMAAALQRYADLGVAVALFAFTPVPGARLASQPPPPLAGYRRLQAARWLIVQGLTDANQFAYDEQGCILSFGLPSEQLAVLLADGENSPFRTSGCADCNRPYYNERPGGDLYNYPRPLTAAEAAAEVAGLLRTLAAEPQQAPNSQSLKRGMRHDQNTTL
jgi:biotin synthase